MLDSTVSYEAAFESEIPLDIVPIIVVSEVENKNVSKRARAHFYTYLRDYLKNETADSAYALGLFYRYRKPCGEWFKKAVDYWELATAKGDWRSAWFLYELYNYGEFEQVVPDPAAALKWLERCYELTPVAEIGNMIAAVNSTDVSAFTPEEFNALCVSFGSETFTLHLLNSQGGKATADVKCELINANPVIYEMFDKTTIGYVRIENFESNSASGLKAAVKALEDAGASALIFDIRDNTGGKTAELADSLDYLLPKGDMFLLQDRNGKETVYTSGSSSVNLPMVVIVNDNTACAAEVFAEVLQSGGAATIVGTQTGGNSQSQVTVELSDGSAVRLSKYLYLTPDRKTLAGLGGVRPDVVSNAIEDSALDVQLEAAKDVVS